MEFIITYTITKFETIEANNEEEAEGVLRQQLFFEDFDKDAISIIDIEEK